MLCISSFVSVLFFFFKIPHISNIICMSFSVWLTSLNMVIFRFIHVAANGIISFFSKKLLTD